MTDLDPADYYVTLLGLNRKEREELKALALEFVEGVVSDCAFMWRGRQKAPTPVALVHRSIELNAAFLAISYSNYGLAGHDHVEVAFALWLCDCLSNVVRKDSLTADQVEEGKV